MTNLFRKKWAVRLDLVCMTYQSDSYHVVGSKLLEGSDPTSRNRMARVFKIPGSRQASRLAWIFLPAENRLLDTTNGHIRCWMFMRPAAAQQFNNSVHHRRSRAPDPEGFCTLACLFVTANWVKSIIWIVMTCYHHVPAVVCLLRRGQGHVEIHTL